MKRYKLLDIFAAVLLFMMAVEIDLPEFNESLNNTQLHAGVNGKQVKQGWNLTKKGWKLLSGCFRKEQPNISPLVERESIRLGSKLLIEDISIIKSSEEILPKIENYVSQTSRNTNNTKVIRCVKGEDDKVRMLLYETGSSRPVLDKMLRVTETSIKLAEYDVHAMQEYTYMGENGIEYVEFIIPRKPQNILNGEYKDRIFECMIFNIPKDIDGRWELFKEYLISFINDILNRPGQLWDEYQFYRGLSELKINARDINEIKQYTFACIYDSYNRNENPKYTEAQVARA